MPTPPACDTLRILHLPPYLSDEKRDELFKRYGATNTKTVRKSNTYTTTFVKFPTKEAATQAFLQLHQLEVKEQYLSIEFAKKSLEIECSDDSSHKLASMDSSEKNDTANAEHFQAFLKKLNTWSSSYNFTQPPPPNISYKYPSPTKNTLLRIAIQLVREPAFYTQVLHLMNKMNLPPPFEGLEAEFPTLKEVYDIEKYRDIFGRTLVENENSRDSLFPEDDEESEMESDEESHVKPTSNVTIKRKLPQSTKKIKIPKFVNPMKLPVSTTSSQKIIRPEDMFESVQREETKNLKIDLKTIARLGDHEEIAPNENVVLQTEGGFGLMFPAKKENDDESPVTDKVKEFITTEELAANKISANDLRLLPVFKNYHAGKASNRLYIKNLSKQVESNDLHYIYRRYIKPSSGTGESEYEIRLMQEGRMKGQAFVTFQNMEQAKLALDDTNGFILKDKPMVVQYAKTAKN